MRIFKKTPMSDPLPTRTIHREKVLCEKSERSFIDFFNQMEREKSDK